MCVCIYIYIYTNKLRGTTNSNVMGSVRWHGVLEWVAWGAGVGVCVFVCVSVYVSVCVSVRVSVCVCICDKVDLPDSKVPTTAT